MDDAFARLLKLVGVTGPPPADVERDVPRVGAADLRHVVPPLRFGGDGLLEGPHAGQQVLVHRPDRGDVHGVREGVGLSHDVRTR
ncbi:hypothetical protein ADK77_16610 [Streptomyces antibioticus]|nr:hypothetical protein ADK77_16610 [Streptomyces antibioticus]